MSKLISFSLLLILASFSSPDISCSNLLKKYAEDHPRLEFVECKKAKGQTVMYAIYEVSQENVDEVERFLIDTYDMGEMKLACCGWETGGRMGSFESKRLQKLNSDYSGLISMYGEAVDENGKAILDRADIPLFYVTVEIVSI